MEFKCVLLLFLSNWFTAYCYETMCLIPAMPNFDNAYLRKLEQPFQAAQAFDEHFHVKYKMFNSPCWSEEDTGKFQRFISYGGLRENEELVLMNITYKQLKSNEGQFFLLNKNPPYSYAIIGWKNYILCVQMKQNQKPIKIFMKSISLIRFLMKKTCDVYYIGLCRCVDLVYPGMDPSVVLRVIPRTGNGFYNETWTCHFKFE